MPRPRKLGLGLLFGVLVAATGCASSVTPDPGLEGLALTKVAPATIVPGTKIVVNGDSFVDLKWGATTLHLAGQAGGQLVDVDWPATFVDFSTMSVAIDAGKIDALGGDVDFDGEVQIKVLATSDGETYSSEPVSQKLSFRKQLTPSPTDILQGVIFVNDQIEVDGSGFLLGGDEGTTSARIAGCFKASGSSTCAAITQQEIAMQPSEELSREHGAFPFAPKIAGIKAGDFVGKVTIVNRQMGGAEVAAQPIDVTYSMVTSQVFSADPPAASLGQYVFIHGGGFVGGENGALTELEMSGTFNKPGTSPLPVSVYLVPEFVEGRLVRYIVNASDEIGRALDLRTETGRFAGTVTPIIHWGADTVRGVSTQITFDLAPVKQVIHLDFTPGYVEALRDFGLRAVDKKIRERILAELARIYEGVNIEFRTEPVTDFAWFSNVTLMGIDPNNSKSAVFGYDNTPGKDDGNCRLYDTIGGFNAVTQADHHPGYGGVFLRSMFAFSKHSGSFIKSSNELSDSMFDRIFDPFRADRDGEPVRSADRASELALLESGDSCPARDRKARIQCAIFVLGNLVGGTLGHEIGHSLGLANPYAYEIHNLGNEPARLMDGGQARSFRERAHLGEAPGVFCDDEYTYLRQILPSKDPPSTVARPTCSVAPSKVLKPNCDEPGQ